MAERVGIRSPSLYNHFRNKEALYHAVLARLLEKFNAPLRELQEGRATPERIRGWQGAAGAHASITPTLARLLQHEASRPAVRSRSSSSCSAADREQLERDGFPVSRRAPAPRACARGS
ncbi:MAG: TetR/AcrR family transcriptional regulator [Gammaproteobacteria bacterium]|nr:TetR/AcrR family transcriptional regulator [Gammaproteobacteria bacterium]